MIKRIGQKVLAIGLILGLLFSIGCNTEIGDQLETKVEAESEVETTRKYQEVVETQQKTLESTTQEQKKLDEKLANNFLKYEEISFLYNEEVFFRVTESEDFLFLFSFEGNIAIGKHPWDSSRLEGLLLLYPEIVREVYEDDFQIIIGGEETQESFFNGRIFYLQVYLLGDPLNNSYEEKIKIETFFAEGKDLYQISLECSIDSKDFYIDVLFDLLESIEAF